MSSSYRETPQPQQGRFSFQHFDQECDFGVENADGQRIKKKKKPGRKPNPPSIQERRAQNRAAQKAFREREQQKREEKEKQWKDYSQEIKSLKEHLASVQYEAKYLKACVLHLTLACLIHRGSVPHIWTESRIIPSNSHGEYKRPVYEPYGQHIVSEAYQTPALLDMLLENQCIVDFDKALFNTSQLNSFENQKKKMGGNADKTASSYQSYVFRDVITINKNSQEPKRNFPKAKKQKINPTNQSPCPELPHKLSPPSLASQHFTQGRYSLSTRSSILDEADATLFPNNTKAAHAGHCNSPLQNNQALSVNQKPVIGILFEPPALRTSEDFANMPPLQALHVVRLQLKLGSILGNITPAALLPTALQRVIPHDIRIDYIPGASIRDRMILFQDYYNMDDCFQFITQNTVFTGGDVRDTRNWVLNPEYSIKFWFLSHHLVDQNYDGYISASTMDVIREELYKDTDSSSEAEDNTKEVASAKATTNLSAINNQTNTKQHESMYFPDL